MADSRDLVYDAWTPMSFKRSMGNRKQPGVSYTAPSWVGEHQRRLQAYKILQAYVDNAAREFLNEENDDKRADHREYGEASLIVNRIVSALLGDDSHISVPLASDFDAGGENDPEVVKAHEAQQWYEQWAEDERFGLKVIETERNAVSLGDGLYTLGWSAEKQRPRLRVFDPGFYFPVLHDGNEDDFPDTVHVAWELETDTPGKRLVRRITWRLAETETPIRYPWNDKPVSVTCLMSDATWKFDSLGSQTIHDFTEGVADYAEYTLPDGTVTEWRDIDLELDFLPVVHEPNTVALTNHYGRSSLATVLQILDDIANADTDLQAASATTGTPPIALSGARLEGPPTYRPGEVWSLGENGRLDVVDTSKSLDALLKYVEALLKRLSVNSRVPESVLGRVDVSGNLAGITLALSFGPLSAMVNEMRLVRDEKYPLLFKLAWRIALAGGMEGVPKEYHPARLEFGSYLPNDLTATVEAVVQLMTVKAIALETGVLMLINAGLPIESIAEEVARIQSRDFAGAIELLDATGDESALFEYLGRKAPAVRTPPPPPPPGSVPPVEGGVGGAGGVPPGPPVPPVPPPA